MATGVDHCGPDQYEQPTASVAEPPRATAIERATTWLRSDPTAPPAWTEARRRLPFIAVVLAAWGLAATMRPIDVRMYLAASVTGVAALGLVLLAPRRHGPVVRVVGDLPSSLLLLAAIALLRASVPSAPVSPYGAVALVPVFWTALYGGGLWQLVVMLVALAGFFAAPPLITGPPAYPHEELLQVIVPVAVATIVCVTARRLVARARREAADARDQRVMIEQVGAVVHGLFASADVRSDLCAATPRVAGATAAILLEPAPGAAAVRITAESGVTRTMLGTTLPAASVLGLLLADGRRRLLSRVDPARLSANDLWEAGGRPATVLYQPLLRRDGKPVGMLIVGWSEVLTEAAARVSAVGLLTHEAALLLSRADQLAHLAGIATTDALTGLPNRRAWDARVKRAIREDEGLAVAMLDLDNFKRFNDTHGHLEGDSLLRDTAAAWSKYVRDGDLLARLGGDEFGLLLPACDEDAAVEVVERLRAAVTHEQTCSTGLAVRRGAEPVESAIGRADIALYAAKRAGRDLARMSV
jgi:diguanylate cyclase (GGDEF)-like protein